MADTWVGHVAATKPEYMKGASDLTIRKRLLFSMLKKRGRIKMNCSGTECKWQVEYSQPAVTPTNGSGVVDFANHDAFRQLTLDWRGYYATDALSQKDKEMNKGENALITLFETKNNRLVKAMQDNLAAEMYRSGTTAGRENNIHGLETFMGSGTTVVADRVAKPDGTYAGRATDVGSEGGSWSDTLTSPNASISTDWPDGNGTSEYDYLTPKLINYASTSWGTPSPSNTWRLNCRHAISQTVTWLSTTGGKDGTPTIAPLAPDLYQGLKDTLIESQRIIVPHKEAEDLGFGDTLNIDGVAIQSDFDCPAQTGYMLNLSTVELCSLFPELLWMEGPDKVPQSLWGYVWGVGFYGNAKYQPKYTAKFHPYAAS